MRFAAVLLLLATGCAATTPHGATEFAWCNFDAGGRQKWLDQAVAKFDAPVVVFCHGDDSRYGRWQLAPDNGPRLDATTVAWVLRQVYHRDVLLISCNAGASSVPVGRVWYPPHSVVWQTPGAEWGIVRGSLVQGVGDVSGLVEGGN